MMIHIVPNKGEIVHAGQRVGMISPEFVLRVSITRTSGFSASLHREPLVYYGRKDQR